MHEGRKAVRAGNGGDENAEFLVNERQQFLRAWAAPCSISFRMRVTSLMVVATARYRGASSPRSTGALRAHQRTLPGGALTETTSPRDRPRAGVRERPREDDVRAHPTCARSGRRSKRRASCRRARRPVATPRNDVLPNVPDPVRWPRPRGGSCRRCSHARSEGLAVRREGQRRHQHVIGRLGLPQLAAGRKVDHRDSATRSPQRRDTRITGHGEGCSRVIHPPAGDTRMACQKPAAGAFDPRRVCEKRFGG